MNKSAVGERVGAIFGSKDDGSVEFFGYGVYEGDFVPEEAVGWIAENLREHAVENPRIRLDSGKVVYGCECWWGPESKVLERLDGAIVIDVDIDEVRRTHGSVIVPGAPHA